MLNKYIHNQRDIPSRTDQLRVAGILDELSEKFFPFECPFINLDARAWEKQITQLNPHFLFVESIWNGYQKTWRRKLTPDVSTDFIRLINWCQKHKVPTIFWNKEDPIHMFTFLRVAFLFDYVFTTDLDCVPLYKRLLGHNRVGVLPFATAIQLFHPIETYQRKEAACFAGSYYAKREERRQDFETIADFFLDNYDLDIYDRNPYPGNPDYTFPERYHSQIKGSLPVEKIDIAYKSYKVGITLNIVKNSSTMEARRIFELLGSNTLTVSNPCLGIKNLFGDLVLQSDDPEQFAHQISAVLGDESVYNRLRLLGLRKVLQEHTYKERLEYLYQRVYGLPLQNTRPKVAVFGVVKTLKDMERLQAAFERQTYTRKKLFLFAASDSPEAVTSHPIILPLDNYQTVMEGHSDYYACFSTRHYYGPNYLMDLVLSTRYALVSAIGKSAHYDATEGTPRYKEELGAYRLIDCLQADRAMFAAHLLPVIDPQAAATGDLWLEHLPCLSIDAFNFCAGYTGQNCTEVDDLQVNTGIPMEELYRISDTLTPAQQNYYLGFLISGKDMRNLAIIRNRSFRIEPHPLDYFAFYTLGNSAQKVFIDKNIILQEILVTNELTGKPTLCVYINGNLSDQAHIYVNYYSENDQFLSGYLVFTHACTSLPVPENANYCKISITTQGNAHGLVKEILLGPKLQYAIALPY